jgi:hypothetical protein
MNIHPEILGQAALLPRPTSYKELCDLVGLIEERLAVLAERTRPKAGTSSRPNHEKTRGKEWEESKAEVRREPQAQRGQVKCWECGKIGHIQRQCKRGSSKGTVAVLTPTTESSKESSRVQNNKTVGRQEKNYEHKQGQGRGSARPRRSNRRERVEKAPCKGSLLWVTVKFAVGNVKALVDTGAQFTCIRRDVLTDLSNKGLKVKSEQCGILCHGVDGSACRITETAIIRCSVGPCTKNFQFKVLDEGPYQAILGLDLFTKAQLVVDVGHREYYFAFAPSDRRRFESWEGQSRQDPKVAQSVMPRRKADNQKSTRTETGLLFAEWSNQLAKR